MAERPAGRFSRSLQRVTTPRRAALLVGIIVISLAIGFGGGTEQEHSNAGAFAWDTFAVAFTALATLALAVYTAGLADSTRQDVSATQRLAAIETARHDREGRPIVVFNTELDVGFAPGKIQINTKLRNVGQGPALSVVLLVLFHPGKRDRSFMGLRHDEWSIMPNETRDVTVTIALTSPTSANGMDFDLAAIYTDRELATVYRTMTENHFMTEIGTAIDGIDGTWLRITAPWGDPLVEAVGLDPEYVL